MNKVVHSEYMSRLINLLKYEFKSNRRNGVYGLTQTKLAYNSNRIEGSTLSEDQTAFIFDTGTIIASGEVIKTKDVEEMTGHFMMFNEMLNTYEQSLSHELIKKYHYRLKSGVFEDMANGFIPGEYKNRVNKVANVKTALPSEVFARMDELINGYNSKENISLYDLAKFHVEYETIHPFCDGNGRTGRIILFKECLKNNIVPFIISDDNKQRYYSYLNSARYNNDYDSMVNYFKEEQDNYYNLTYDFVIPYDLDKEDEKPKFDTEIIEDIEHDISDNR